MVQVEKTTDNALRVLHVAGLQGVPVVRGQSSPLVRPTVSCPQIHGDSGLDGPDIPNAQQVAEVGAAVNVMYHHIVAAYRT